MRERSEAILKTSLSAFGGISRLYEARYDKKENYHSATADKCDPELA